MALYFSQNPHLVPGSRRIALASLLQQEEGNGPQYVVLAGLDRHYPQAGQELRQGNFHGMGRTYDIVAPGSDSFGFGLVFTHTLHGFYNNTYGFLDEMVFTPSHGSFRSEYLALYGFGKGGTPDAGVLDRLEAEVACPLFDAGVFGITEIYGDAVHLGTLDLATWTVFSDAAAKPARTSGIATGVARLMRPSMSSGNAWPAIACNISSELAYSNVA